MYKIDKKEYWAIHYWIRKNRGQANKCVTCGKSNTETEVWWANISGEYKKDLNDYEQLCCSCHRKKDYTDEWRKKISIVTSGKRNPFYGKKHKDSSKKIIGESSKKRNWGRDERGHFKKLLSICE